MNVLSKLAVLIATAVLIGTTFQVQRADAQGKTAPTSPVTGNAANGKSLFYAYSCFSCHGYNGETGRAFVGNWSSNLASEENFIKFLRARANAAPLTPSTDMPSFAEKTMSDKQAKDIYAYIRTFKAAPPDPKNIPVLSQMLADASKSSEK
jgi:mono/diheme cytochrome c family protein